MRPGRPRRSVPRPSPRRRLPPLCRCAPEMRGTTVTRSRLPAANRCRRRRDRSSRAVRVRKETISDDPALQRAADRERRASPRRAHRRGRPAHNLSRSALAAAGSCHFRAPPNPPAMGSLFGTEQVSRLDRADQLGALQVVDESTVLASADRVPRTHRLAHKCIRLVDLDALIR